MELFFLCCSLASKNKSFYFSLWLYYLISSRIRSGPFSGGSWTVLNDDEEEDAVEEEGAPFGETRGFSQSWPKDKEWLGNLLPSVVSIIHKLSNKSNLFNLI